MAVEWCEHCNKQVEWKGEDREHYHAKGGARYRHASCRIMHERMARHRRVTRWARRWRRLMRVIHWLRTS